MLIWECRCAEIEGAEKKRRFLSFASSDNAILSYTGNALFDDHVDVFSKFWYPYIYYYYYINVHQLTVNKTRATGHLYAFYNFSSELGLINIHTWNRRQHEIIFCRMPQSWTECFVSITRDKSVCLNQRD